MFSSHSSRSAQVRRLWVDFELWHAAQLEQIEKQVKDAIRDLDTKFPPPKNRRLKKELEQQKAAARSDIEKSFDGNRVREEWDTRLRIAGLRSDEWDDISPEEQRKVEKILGADLELDDPDTTVLDTASPPQPSSFTALPLTHDSRSSSTSDTYAIVDPHTFNTFDENSYDTWVEVRQNGHKSDDEFSLGASTASSFGWGNSDAAAYTSWSSARSSTQSSQTSSPEWSSSKFLPSESLVASAAKRLTAATERSHDTVAKAPVSTSNDRIRPHSLHPDSSTLLMSQPHAPQEPTNDSRGKSKSRGSYVGPHLTDSSEVSDEEAEFEKFKMSIRIQKIREFHNEAADADIRLTLAFDEARRSKKCSKEEDARRVQEHEALMHELRQRKEEERKEIVNAERQKRRAELKQRSTKDPPPSASTSSVPKDPHSLDTGPSVTQQFLKALQGSTDGSQSSNASDTPTIRQTTRRPRKQSLQADWTSGNDTPTPTNRTSGWTLKQSMANAKPAESSGLAEAPPLKRLATAPASTLSQSHQSTLSSASERTSKVPPAEESTVFGSKKSKSAKGVPEPTTAPAPAPASNSSASKKSNATPTATTAESVAKNAVVEPAPADNSATKTKTDTSSKSRKKAKSKEVITEVETEGASSSKQTLEQMPIPSQQHRVSKAEPAQAWVPHPDTTSKKFTSSTSVSSSAIASASTSSINLPGATLQSQLPDNRRVWIPPATENIPNTRAAPPRKMTLDPPLVVEKSLSVPQGYADPHAGDEVFRRARRLSDPVSPSPRSFEFPTNPVEPSPAPGVWRTSKGETKQPETAAAPAVGVWRTSKGGIVQPEAAAAAPTPASGAWRTSKGDTVQPEATPAAAPSSILKKTKSDSTTPAKTSSKKKGKKKVTIEEVDESEETKGAEKLPVDSRFIIEPKPVVPQAAFAQIFEYGTEETGLGHVQANGNRTSSSAPAHTQQAQYSASTNTARRNEPASSNEYWLPTSDGNATVGRGDFEWGSLGDVQTAYMSGNSTTSVPTMQQSSGQFSSQEKHVRWRPSALEYEGTGEDLFLSALDSLEAIVRGSNDQPESEDDLSLDMRLASPDVRAGTAAWSSTGGRKDKKGRGTGKERDGEDVFWQHAMASLGGRGAASASAM